MMRLPNIGSRIFPFLLQFNQHFQVIEQTLKLFSNPKSVFKLTALLQEFLGLFTRLPKGRIGNSLFDFSEPAALSLYVKGTPKDERSSSSRSDNVPRNHRNALESVPRLEVPFYFPLFTLPDSEFRNHIPTARKAVTITMNILSQSPVRE